jgi:oligosaccharide repeat unit polymerase
MIAYLPFAGILLGLTVVNYYVGRRNVLYPPFLFSLSWFVVFCLCMIPLIEVNKLGADTLAIVVLGAAAFSAGGAVVGGRRSVRNLIPVGTPSGGAWPRKIILFYCLAVLPAFYLEVRSLSAAGGFAGFMISARAAVVAAVENGQNAFGGRLYSTAIILSTFNAFVFLIEARDWRKEWYWILGSILTALCFSVLTTGRTPILGLGVGLVGIYLLRRRRFSFREAWKFVRWPLLVCLALFTILVPLNKDISGMEGGATDAVGQFVFGYCVIPLAGFDYVLRHPSEYKYEPDHTFRDILPALASVSGMRYSPPPTLDDFVQIPLPTNTYTVFKPYYLDFGLAGMLFSMFLLAAVQTWLFRRALAGAPFYVFLFAVSLYPLVLAFFDDAYSSIRGNFEAFIFAVLYFGVLKGQAWWRPVGRARFGSVSSAMVREHPGCHEAEASS